MAKLKESVISEKQYKAANLVQICRIEVGKQPDGKDGLAFSWNVSYLDYMKNNPALASETIEAIQAHVDDLKDEYLDSAYREA